MPINPPACSMSGLIVVGVDGSKASLEALRWAANQARLTSASLEVVTTWEYPKFLRMGAGMATRLGSRW